MTRLEAVGVAVAAEEEAGAAVDTEDPVRGAVQVRRVVHTWCIATGGSRRRRDGGASPCRRPRPRTKGIVVDEQQACGWMLQFGV